MWKVLFEFSREIPQLGITLFFAIRLIHTVANQPLTEVEKISTK
jgi:hypothetical protein